MYTKNVAAPESDKENNMNYSCYFLYRFLVTLLSQYLTEYTKCRPYRLNLYAPSVIGHHFVGKAIALNCNLRHLYDTIAAHFVNMISFSTNN